jgi:hypothetical protein
MEQQSRKVHREELYELVCSKPTRDLAKGFGISDVALGKIGKKMNVPKPPPGHWQRIAAGHKVTLPSLPKPEKGQQLVVEIWPTPHNTDREQIDPIVQQKIHSERLPINKIIVSDDLRGAHRLIRYTNTLFHRFDSDRRLQRRLT